MPNTCSGGDIAADIIAQNVEEAIDTLVEHFLREYPQSSSATLSANSLSIWTRDYLADLEGVLRGGSAAMRPPAIYTGDMMLRTDPLFESLYTYTET